MTSLADLDTVGGFVSDQPVKRTVTWRRKHLKKDDIEVDVWVRPMSAADFDAIMSLPSGEPRMVVTVATLVTFGVDGGERLTPEKARQLDPYLMLALSNAVNDAAPEGKA